MRFILIKYDVFFSKCLPAEKRNELPYSKIFMPACLFFYLELLFAKKTWSFGGGFVAQFSIVFFAQSPYHMTYNYKVTNT